MPDYGVRSRGPSSFGRNRLKYDARAAKVKIKKLFQNAGAALSFIGKPFFVLLSGLVIFFVSLSWAVGRTTIYVLSRLQIQIPHIRLPKIPLFAKTFLLIFLFLSAAWFILLRDLPQPGELVTRDRAVSTKIYDRDGELLFKIFRSQNRTLVPLGETPIHVRQATIAIEDAGFYSHPGFSARGMTRAIWRNVTRGELSGGSTITQQLVKNALLSPEKTYTRKAKEMILAVQVEIKFEKDQILEMYLNEVGYGGAAYGIQEAAQLYFAKDAQDLTLAEGALLAGLPKAPTTYSPFGANPALAKARQLEALSRMVQEGYITQEQAEKAARQQLVFAPQRTDIKAPHFVMYVKELLAKKYGERALEEGGLEVITSLDLDIQRTAEKVVQEEVEKIARLRVSNGAALVTNPRTGEILAMVGSKDYFSRNIDGNFNVTTAQRQPGSAIKPVNYSYALESGRFTATTILSDTPITYSLPGSKPYSPRNYDNRFRGRVPLRTALGSSFNVPAVKVLASYGVRNMIEQGKKLGITTWEDPSRFGLSLTLGGGEVKMLDLAVAYGTLANYGKRVDLNPILRVTDYRGKVLEENGCKVNQVNSVNRLTHSTARAAEAATAETDPCGTQVLDPRAAFILTDILRDNLARIPAFGARSLLVIPSHTEVAVKTGTTQNLRDNWAIGYTKDFIVAAWVGNNDNTPMSYIASGVTGATPIWHEIMRGLLTQNTGNPYWQVPEGITQVPICSVTGTLACEGCPTRMEYFLQGTEPTYACNPEQLRKQQEEREKTEGEIL